MEPFQRFSILTFPQSYQDGVLNFNIVVLPRDQNPLAPAIINSPPLPNSETAFADAQFVFRAKVLSGFDISPLPQPTADVGILLEVETPENAREIFEALSKHMNIDMPTMNNSNATLAGLSPDRKPEAPRSRENSVKKYIPKTFFEASGIKTISNKNAVTDDSYQCALKDGKFDPDFKQSTDSVSWGKVFAYLLRQPLLARQAGMIFSASIPIEEDTFPEGGYLYVDIDADSSYFDQQSADDTFIKRYAARIPALAPGDDDRSLFASVLFPVVQVHQGNYDELFIEASEFDDGFTKIVHTFQPRNRNFIIEESDGNYPVKDVGIEFSFDDIFILERYMRQLMEDISIGAGKRIDAPMGVYGFNIDVREVAVPENNWESLNHVMSKQPLVLLRNPGASDDFIVIGDFDGELPFQVYPVQINARKELNYWLPMYYGAWNGHSVVLPDEDAALIYQNTNDEVDGDDERVVLDENGDPVLDENGKPVTTGTGVKPGGSANQLNQIYETAPLQTELLYGNNYELRARMQDISGGSPSIDSEPIDRTPSDTSTCRFKRYIAPNQPRIQELQPTGNDDDTIANNDEVQEITELNIRRPKLGYPSVVFTGKYDDAVQRLIAQSQLGIDIDENDPNANSEHRVGLGIADPDVDRVEVIVEIASLKMDKLGSVSKKEDYVHLYTTYRNFPTINEDDDYEANLNIPLEYVDVNVLHTGDEVDIMTDLNLPGDIDGLTQIVLPTGRTARLTLRAVCEEKVDNLNYYGVINDGNKQMDIRYGEVIQIATRKASENETDLFEQTAGVPELQGIFMQPDLKITFDGKFTSFLLGKEADIKPDNVQLLAGQLKMNNNKLTLTAPKGERYVFGCSSRIRHSLAPDNSSITFASKGDLINHWLCCISLEINRDWMWDELKTTSFRIKRTKKYTNDANPESVDALVGDIEMIRTAPFDAFINPNRDSVRIIFIDAVEPKKDKPDDPNEPYFPDTIELKYTIETQFKNPNHQAVKELEIVLPITTTPEQVPKIASAGYALSPYARNETYSASEIRQRYLWIEFSEPIKDPNDIYFGRVLHIAPDQLISNNNLGLLEATQDPPLPIDPEFMRVVIPESSNDFAGLTAMQPMEKSKTSDLHYLLPVPEGLHANSDELFGFFTYEFRVGHYRNPNNNEMVWTTAQGRFGRRLKATGIQHPAPTLTCMANRDEDKLWVTAPYAVAVNEGKNVTAIPPRTELWALLYAQVKQADNLDFRNILLDDKYLDWRLQIVPKRKKEVDILQQYSTQEIQLLNEITYSQFNQTLNYTNHKNVFQLMDFSNKNEDAAKYGTTAWTNKEVQQLLSLMGLPEDSDLSVIVVEILPQTTNVKEHISKIKTPRVKSEVGSLVADGHTESYSNFVNDDNRGVGSNKNRKSPVDEELGNKRIYRTSNLTPIPAICCTDC